MLACPCVKRDVVFYMAGTGENTGQNLQKLGYLAKKNIEFGEMINT